MLLLAAFILLAGLAMTTQTLATHNDDPLLVSRTSGPDGEAAGGGSPSISADGRFVAFVSSNLDPDDTDQNANVYVRDLEENTTTLASRASGARGATGNDSSGSPSISADGRFAAFTSGATNLDPDAAETTTYGRSNVFVRDLEENTTTLVSRRSGASGQPGNAWSSLASISADGRFVAFQSAASNLVPEAFGGVFVRDLEENTTTLASRASGADGEAGAGLAPSISAGGRLVAFASYADLDTDATEGTWSIFVRDLEQHTTTLVSRASGADGEAGNGWGPSISAGGRFVAFHSCDNLHPDATTADCEFSTMPGPPFATFARYLIFVRDREENTTTLASRASGADGAPAESTPDQNIPHDPPSISADGRFVAFTSDATNLHPERRPGLNVYLRDLREDTTTLTNQFATCERSGWSPSISADGRFVGFSSWAVFRRDVRDFAHPPPSPVTREAKLPARLEIRRALVRGGRLVVRGSLDSAAAGEPLALTFGARGRQLRLRLGVGPEGQFHVRRALRGPQRRARAGRLVVRFAGNEMLRPTSDRLRVAPRPVRLRIGRAEIERDRLALAGRVVSRARGWARIRVEFNHPNCSPDQITDRAKVNRRGRFRIRLRVPLVARHLGANVSVTHPGRGRLHGQRLGRDTVPVFR